MLVQGYVYRTLSCSVVIKSVYLLQDLKTGRSRGYGFVEMETLEDAESALSSSKQQIDNYMVFEFLSNSGCLVYQIL